MKQRIENHSTGAFLRLRLVPTHAGWPSSLPRVDPVPPACVRLPGSSHSSVALIPDTWDLGYHLTSLILVNVLS